MKQVLRVAGSTALKDLFVQWQYKLIMKVSIGTYRRYLLQKLSVFVREGHLQVQTRSEIK